jgi:hypothetical protein
MSARQSSESITVLGWHLSGLHPEFSDCIKWSLPDDPLRRSTTQPRQSLYHRPVPGPRKGLCTRITFAVEALLWHLHRSPVPGMSAGLSSSCRYQHRQRPADVAATFLKRWPVDMESDVKVTMRSGGLSHIPGTYSGSKQKLRGVEASAAMI